MTRPQISPYSMCLDYAAGIIDREILVTSLVRFEYAKTPWTSGGYDNLIIDPPGTWAEVSDAHRRGLIDDSIYEEVFNLRILR